jgi:hypothetical protein
MNDVVQAGNGRSLCREFDLEGVVVADEGVPACDVQNGNYGSIAP